VFGIVIKEIGRPGVGAGRRWAVLSAKGVRRIGYGCSTTTVAGKELHWWTPTGSARNWKEVNCNEPEGGA
jgi:hypothetical protein